MVELRIGIDYDGTLADTGAAKAAWIREHLGLELEPWQTDRSMCVPLIGEDNYRRMGRAVYSPEATLRAAEVPGVADALRALRDVALLYVVSARSHDQLAWSKEWLREHGLDAYISGYLSSAEIAPDGRRLTKAQWCREKRIQILIDDDQRHLELAEPGLRRILLKHGCEEDLAAADGVEVATSWDQIVRMITDRET